MLRRVQFWIGSACIACLLCSLAGLADTSVRPVIDHQDDRTYCTQVADALAQATASVDLLLSNAELEENPLWESLTAAHARGVRVRVLLDESDWSASITARNRPAIEFLRAAGVDARFDDPAVTTHAKLAIIDRTIVILGSSNWNRYALTEQEQANVRIDDERVGVVFGDWFDRLWTMRNPGTLEIEAGETLAGPGPRIVALPDADGSTVYASFVLELLASAQTSVHVVLYRMSIYPSYTDSLANDLARGLIAAAGRGLDVRVLLDDCSFYADSASANLTSALYLYEHGIPVRFDRPSETTHAKLLIVDGEHAVLGSTNWNYYALERNVEANVALLGMPRVATAYEAFFQAVWRAGREVGR